MTDKKNKIPFLYRHRAAAICLLLVTVIIVVFGQVYNHDFINYDDDMYVTKNNFIQKGFTVESISWAFTTGYASNWHPLTWLSHMLDYRLFDLNPTGHHLTSVFFHTINTLLLFLVLNLMTGAIWKSAFVAAVFAVHPTHVESVAWIAERKDVLSTFFWMSTIGAYVYYCKCPGIKRYMAVLILFSLGLMAKPMLVTLPFVFILLDFWPLQRIQVRQFWTSFTLNTGKYKNPGKQGPGTVFLVGEKIPLFILSAVSCAVTVYVQQKGGAVKSLDIYPFNLRIANALISYVRYIGKTLWPQKLAVLYPHPVDTLPLWQAAGSCIILIAVSVIVIRKIRRYPYLIVGWLWYLGVLVPVIGLIHVGIHTITDRYTYIPSIGLFIMAAWGFPEIIKKWRFQRIVLPILTGVILSASAMASFLQVRHWQNSYTLFTHALSTTSENYLAHNNLGVFLIGQGKIDEALNHYTEALRIMPGYVNANINMGFVLMHQGKLDKALKHYTEALPFKPESAEHHCYVGNVLARMEKYDEAIEYYTRALRFKPDFAEAHNNLGSAFVRQGKFNEAVEHYNEAIRLKPDYTEARKNLENVLNSQVK